MMPRLCLNMIVKNEEAIIYETLENIYQHIPFDYFVISDTGSTDATVQKIEDFSMNYHVEGEVYSDPWQNFAHNRNKALEHCRGKADYVLIFDADDRLWGNFPMPDFSKDSYSFLFKKPDGGVTYTRPLLFRNNDNFFWQGVVHEFINHHNDYTSEIIQGDYGVISGRFGARSRNPKKYYEDALLLIDGYEKEPDLRQRYAFYAAQSFRDADMPEDAITWYEKRLELGGWSEEITCSYENLGQLYLKIGQEEKAIVTWLKGYDQNPKRAECLYHVVEYYRRSGNTRLAHQLALIAHQLKQPETGLFINSLIYDYWLPYELSITSYYVQDTRLGYECCKHVLLSDYNKTISDITWNNLFYYKELLQEEEPSVVETLKTLLSKSDASGSNLPVMRDYLFNL